MTAKGEKQIDWLEVVNVEYFWSISNLRMLFGKVYSLKSKQTLVLYETSNLLFCDFFYCLIWGLSFKIFIF